MASERKIPMDLASVIRTVPNFPKKGIMFRDITTLLKDRAALHQCIDAFYEHYKSEHIDKVVGIESRGFICGAALADRLGAGFVPIRKPGKLPAGTLRQEYQLEYGSDAIEIHRDAISKGERILLHDDLLATGGTIQAACKLVEQLGGQIVGLSFLIELSFLNPRKRLAGYTIFSLVAYDKE
ncbi:MAG TPA: adenine phosphoribosyltransferase [Bacteroidota bacterium]|nr:adenine phosphoribosyltransferase [Bacteroidota bacterium]